MAEPLLIIAGPTAVGKSALAIRLAQTLGGEIINLDSVQIYRDFIIGAAQPTEEEKKTVPHHVYGSVAPSEKMSVGKYVKIFAPVLKDLATRGKVPIFCGGTSLYINGVIYGLSDLPENADLREEIETFSTDTIFDFLRKEDPVAAASIHPNDRLRLARALEVKRLGISIADAHDFHKKQSPRSAIIIVPMLPRDILYARINSRTVAMLERGLIKETEYILARYGNDASGLRSIGYKESVEYLTSNKYSSQEHLADAISQATRQFAKRQMTWARNEPGKKSWEVRPSERDVQLRLISSAPLKKNRGEDFLVWDCGFKELSKTISHYLSQKRDEPPSIQLWFVPAEKML